MKYQSMLWSKLQVGRKYVARFDCRFTSCPRLSLQVELESGVGKYVGGGGVGRGIMFKRK